MLEEKVKSYLTNLGIKFKIHKHSAVFTCEQARELCKGIEGIKSKNLFLKNLKAEKFFLVILPDYKRLDIKNLEKITEEKLKHEKLFSQKQFLRCSKTSRFLTFANDEELEKILGIKAGAVSPFTLINNSDVVLVIDKEIWNSKIVSFHPCINTETLELDGKDFQKFVSSLKNRLVLI